MTFYRELVINKRELTNKQFNAKTMSITFPCICNTRSYRQKNDVNNDFRIYGIHLKNHDLLNSMGIEFKEEGF